MNIHLIVLAYALAHEVGNLLRSLNGPDVTIHLFLHSRRPDVENACDQWGREPNVRYYRYGKNRGLGKSVNEGIEIALFEQADAIIVPNDDILMDRADLDKLAQACYYRPECGLIFARGMDNWPLDFHVFGVNQSAIKALGYFDESFPDYFCDADYMRRAQLIGLTYHNIGQTNIVHLGSGTLNNDPVAKRRIDRTYSLDQTHYIAKHGGPPGSETFLFPFDDPELSWIIPSDKRHNPYPTHQRPESEMNRE